MVTVSDIYSDIKNYFKASGITDFRFEAICLVEDILGINLMSDGGNSVSEKDKEKLLLLAGKRVNGYPLQYILGRWEFYGLPFSVGEGVLIPRPDTETLVEAVLSLASSDSVIIDLCSGSGCIAVAAQHELENASVYAVEKSPKALSYLIKNAEINHSGIKVIEGDVLLESTSMLLPQADIIVSNPPYLTERDMKALQREVSFEPEAALYGGTDGLLFYRGITAVWKKKLKYRGILAFEIGIGQEKDVEQIMKLGGFDNIKIIPDLSGINRVVIGFKQ